MFFTSLLARTGWAKKPNRRFGFLGRGALSEKTRARLFASSEEGQRKGQDCRPAFQPSGSISTLTFAQVEPRANQILSQNAASG